MVAGIARYQGCPIPDTDKDGVNDEDDKCPNEPGPATNFGCPVIERAIIEKVNIAAKNILFATGSSKLLGKSYASLNNIITILKDHPNYKIDIEGHTDSTGTHEKNMVLSNDRAASVKAYLVSHGIDESRITSAGFGPDKSIATNQTIAGRIQNRRVEMRLRNY
ncbi:MAG: OmpA family protein [Bacteroidota bacterium]|nr:OmpA family protein [Bacteroidota bacterium]